MVGLALEVLVGVFVRIVSSVVHGKVIQDV